MFTFDACCNKNYEFCQRVIDRLNLGVENN